MNGTPRPRPGGFPSTPQHQQARSPGAHTPSTSSTSRRPNVNTPLPDVPQPAAHATQSSGPWIPAHIIDPAQQRLYVCSIYIALWGWKLYDFYNLAIEEDESVWSCMKWCGLDMTFFMLGVPLLDIPWLQWSTSTSFMLFVLHSALDVMLMFRIGIPVQAWFISLAGFLFDSELAISERSVKPGPILHNASLILGKQIINILPEGSAVLNPEKLNFCLNSTVTSVDIPILINQTEPVELDLVRLDFDTNQNETISIRKNELKALLKKARKAAKRTDPEDPLLLRYTVKKPGVYLLKKVVDQSKLEVRPRSTNAVVVKCPQARVKPTGDRRCRNDLSNVELEVEGVPPLYVKYRLTVDRQPRGGSEFQNLQPDEFASPLTRHTSQALVKSGKEDVSWARSHKVTVPLNETLATGSGWEYAVEEVHDGLGNLVSFVGNEEGDHPKAKITGTYQGFEVHERPRIFFNKCNPQNPMRVAKGHSEPLPINYASTGKNRVDTPHRIQWLFTPEADIVADGYHSANAVISEETIKPGVGRIRASDAGLYTLKSVSTGFCEGDVLEPTSCLVQNPPVPELELSSEDIIDKCAGNPIGLRVDMDFIGTPPFFVKYIEQQKGKAKAQPRDIQIGSLKGSIDLAPENTGHYTYTFKSISDAVYNDQPLHNLVLQQEVRAPASAHFIENNRPKQACIDDYAEFDVGLTGDGPYKLEYEVMHNGKRNKQSIVVEGNHYTIKTPKLKNGGEYTVALVSIVDGRECKDTLKNQEAKVQVRHERPKAYFGLVDGKQSIMALEGKKVDLPLRLSGVGPWSVEYENLDTDQKQRVHVSGANAPLSITQQGTYHLRSVSDSVCPGFIEEKASTFNVGWIARPQISIPETASIVFDNGRYVKDAVCEGDEDSFEVALTGNAPFEVSYKQEYKGKGKTAAPRDKDLRAVSGLTTIRADTANAGTYEYTFHKLADSRYDHSKRNFQPLVVQQTINPRPSARFDTPGKTYSYCSRESDGEEVIPMTLEGQAPFYLEVEIKQAGIPKPEISVHRDIRSPKFDLKIEHRKLHLGVSSITIRKVRDARGCTFKPSPASPRVQVSVHDAPTATALEERVDFCVGERLSFALSGQNPFTVYYTFNGETRKASNAATTFRRLAELPGTFTITGLRDSASDCLAPLDLTKHIHPIPSVRLSGGQVSSVDIHEGGNTDLHFQFEGTPPFEFTYTRSTNAARGKKSRVLEIKTEVSHEKEMFVPVQEEGTYEVVSIKDRWCGFAKQVEGVEGRGGQKLLQY
ncbi:hypothetical protein P171DRAFT_388522 [Karstenula rhodostoma CBS 690.94]|uniref:Nucleoporin Pom152 n=1 Tax=Karstenula rhodostoma CBS 690.94 TaxID=1392251 RepID=A0A9P4PHH5_9PLEO|nr:hypothetical protein P171DRAFT_388522 [Karstenula rhodostoma CBS 690.94]